MPTAVLGNRAEQLAALNLIGYNLRAFSAENWNWINWH